MHIDTEPLTEHSARVGNTPVAVDPISNGDAVQKFVFFGLLVTQVGRVQNTADIEITDLMPAYGHFVGQQTRLWPPAAQVDNDVIDILTGHLLSRFHRGPNGRLCLSKINHGAITQSV